MIIKKNRQIFIFDDDNDIVEYDIVEDKIISNVCNNELLDMDIDESEQYFEDKNMWYMFRDIGKREDCFNL